MRIAVIDRFYKNQNAFSRQLKFPGHEVIYIDKIPCFTEFDIIHYDWCDDLAISGTAQISRLSERPRVTIRLHAYEVHENWIHQINWQAVDQLVFVSKHYQDIFNSKILHKNQCVVNHGIDLSKFMKVEHTGSHILYVGSINFKKGPQLLAQVALSCPDREVHVYGDVQCERSQLYFDHLKISNLKFFPHNNNIKQIMERPEYEFIVSTSLGESFHLAMAEGMACGLKPLVHDWYGAKELWPVTWKSIDGLKSLVLNHPLTSEQCRKWIETRYNATTQHLKLTEAIMGSKKTTKIKTDKKTDHHTVAVCMITRDNYAGIERAIKSCISIVGPHTTAQYIDAAYIAVDSRDTDDTLNKLKTLSKDLSLKIVGKHFTASEPWDFSYARNIAHSMNECEWALVLDDDEYVMNPEEIPELLENCADKDVVDISCGMGVDEYGNVGHTWKFSRFMKQKVKWINARHNIPDSTTYKSSTIWTGDIIVIDDKTIKKQETRNERHDQRNTNIEVFLKKVYENAHDTRSMFYLAMTLRESGKYWEAIHWYNQYLNTGGWDEERWQACYDMAICQLNLRRYTEARKSLHRAIEEKCDRAEAFVFMGDILYECGDFEGAYIWYKLGSVLPYPEDARLFVSKSIYDWERYDKLAMVCHHLEKWDEALSNGKLVLEKRPRDERVQNNIKQWTDKLGE